LNYSTGSMELKINTDEVNLEGDIIAACGKFNFTEKIIPVILERVSEIDSDADGIRDQDDLCDSTPEGEAVYSDGCSDSERDSDNDGVSDAEDQCPSTPIGEQPDSQGCSDSQKDSDSDGVNDAEDQCPSTPAGNAVDSTGCSIVTWGPQDSWYCQDGNGPWVRDDNGVGNNYNANTNGVNTPDGSGSGPWFQCEVSVTSSSTSMNVNSNGIPNHDWVSALGPGGDEQTLTWSIPLNPTNDTNGGHTSTNCPAANGQWECAADRGQVAVATNGVPIFGPEEGPGGDAVALDFFYFDEDRQPIDLGYCGAHAGPTGVHYHWDAMCQYWEPESGQTMQDYDWSLIDSTQHSPIIGWSFDGYPIYGMYTWDDSGAVKGMKSSYEVERTSEGGDQGYNGIDDWNYVSGSGDLDECNGRFGPTPEYPEGTYYYVSTPLSGSSKTVVDTDGNTVPMVGFPYFLLCYHGIADDSNGGGGQGGGGGGGMGPQAKSVYEHMPELIHTTQSSQEVTSLLWDTTWILLLLIGITFTRQRKESSEVTILENGKETMECTSQR
ncbi:MAG: YHYH protein, partial [Candidatus Poseidoniales archaeon]